MEKITVLTFAVGKEPVLKEIDNDHTALRDEVGGYLEVVRLPHDIVMWVNEEGKMYGLQPNFNMVRNGAVIDVVVGNAVFTSTDGDGETTSLTAEQQEHVLNFFSHRNVFTISQ